MPIAKRKNVNVTAAVSSGKPLIRSFELSATLVENVKVSLTIAAVADSLDSLGELSETQSLMLQMAMDRQSKFMETLSNILREIADTDSSIVQNLK